MSLTWQAIISLPFHQASTSTAFGALGPNPSAPKKLMLSVQNLSVLSVLDYQWQVSRGKQNIGKAQQYKSAGLSTTQNQNGRAAAQSFRIRQKLKAHY